MSGFLAGGKTSANPPLRQSTAPHTAGISAVQWYVALKANPKMPITTSISPHRSVILSIVLRYAFFYGCAHTIPPLCPGAIVIAYVFESQQMRQHEPGVGRTFPDATVDDDVICGFEM